MAQVLRRTDPLDVEVNGRRRRIWLLFAGNGRYGPSAFSTAGRARLDGDVLDVRIVDAEHRWARTRVIAAALTGRLQRSGVYDEQVVRELTLALGSGAALARDGEAKPAPRRYAVRSACRVLTVYRPQPR
jgi:diacylglycerol kinase family enzyme